jgi:hypothetical protein
MNTQLRDTNNREWNKSLLQKASDAIYVAQRAWLLWIFPIIYAGLPTYIIWWFWQQYYQNYQKHVAWTVEKILKIRDECSPIVLEKRNADKKLTDSENCKVEIIQENTAWVTTEHRQAFYDDWKWDYTYWPHVQVEKYPEWAKDYISKLSPWSIYDVKTYERNGEFLWFIPRVAPYSTLSQVPYEFNLNSPLWRWSTAFQRAKNFELIPGVNVPTDIELKSLWASIVGLISNPKWQNTLKITGIASPEWITPNSLTGQDPISYDKNRELAYKRAEYVKGKLLEFYPELSTSMKSIEWLVNRLNPEQEGKLTDIARKLWIKEQSLQSIDMLIKKFEDWTIDLSEDDREYIISIFTRSVKVSLEHELGKKWWWNIWEETLDYNLWILIFPVFICYLMWIVFLPYMVFARWRQKIHRDYYSYSTWQSALFKGRQERLWERAMRVLDGKEKDFIKESKGEYL